MARRQATDARAKATALAVVAFGAWAVPTAAAAAETLAAFTASAQLEPSQPGQGLYRVSLPLALLRHARTDDRRDVRVFNAAGEPVPIAWAGIAPPAQAALPRRVELARFVWPQAQPQEPQGDGAVHVEVRRDGTVVRVERRGISRRPVPADGAAAVWLLDLSTLAGARPAAIELQWRSQAQGTVRSVAVVASRDTRDWRSVGDGAVLELHDSASGQSSWQRRVALQALDPDERYLQLQFNAPLALESALAEMPVAAVPQLLDSERFRLSRSDPVGWTLDTGAALPVRQLQVHVPQDNSVLPMAILRRVPATGPGQVAAWVQVADHIAYRMVRDGVTVQSLPLDTGGQSAAQWRFKLHERVAAPELGLDATLSWVPVQLVFAARGPGPYQLALGHAHAEPAALERSALIPGYREGDEFTLPLLRPGVVTERPVRSPSITERLTQAGPQQQRRWILWGTLSMAVVVLALLARRLLGDLRAGRAGTADR
jgi:hypothetical protein